MTIPDWITLHISQDTSNVSVGYFTHEIDIRPSNILSMTVICHSEHTRQKGSNIANTMIRLNEPEDRFTDDDLHVSKNLRELHVFESIEQIRELIGHPTRNGLPRGLFVHHETAGAEATP